MKKTGLFSNTVSALLITSAVAAMTGWTAVRAEQATGDEPAAGGGEPLAVDEATAPRGWSRPYHRDRGRDIERSKALARERQEQMERWRSWRRWMNSPAAEERRQWNRARSQFQRDLAEQRRDAAEQRRTYYRKWYRDADGVRYGYEEWGVERPEYRYGPRY